MDDREPVYFAVIVMLLLALLATVGTCHKLDIRRAVCEGKANG
jgi:hypothetical protein